MIGSGSVSLVALVTLRPVAFGFAFAAGIFVSTALSLLTRGFPWLLFLVTADSVSTGGVPAAFVRALVVLVVVGAGVTGPALLLVDAVVAVVDLLAMIYQCERRGSGNHSTDFQHARRASRSHDQDVNTRGSDRSKRVCLF